MLENWNWTWPAIVLAFLLGALGTRWIYHRLGFGRKETVNREYFKGLNFLLNEETDKAIEVFIKALEVDSETVELHLALGGLFRRKGQVDRATRIHQNLIARPTLTDGQRMQAVHELAQDYHKAGWLDRAENLFLELMESREYKPLALNGLCKIYQQEKEWQKAIDVLRQHKRTDRPLYAKQVTHYLCELAELDIQGQDFESAEQHLNEANSESPEVARVALLRGELRFARGDFRGAIDEWQTLIQMHPTLSQLVIENTIESYQNLGDHDGLKRYLLETPALPKDKLSFLLWQSAMEEQLGAEESLQLIFKRVHRYGLSSPVAAYLNKASRENRLDTEFRDTLLTDLLNQAKKSKIEYTCAGCGFDTKAMYWFCPNCGEWESFQ